MKEKEIPIRQVCVVAECDCGKGTMRLTGTSLLTDPPQYPHRCTVCSKTENLLAMYPHNRNIETEEV